MKHHAFMAMAGLLLSQGIGCSSNAAPSNSNSTGGAGGNSGSPFGGNSNAGNGGGNVNTCASLATDAAGNLKIVAAPENNYSFSSKLTLAVDTVAPKSELTFDWSALTTDMLKHPIDPAKDVTIVLFSLWNLTKEQLETQLNDDALDQSAMAAVSMIYTKNATNYPTSLTTSGTLSDLTLFGNAIDHTTLLGYLDTVTYDPATHIYTVMVSSGAVEGQGIRMLKAARLDQASTNTKISVDSTSTTLEYTANLHSLQTVQVPTGKSNISIDWTGMDNKSNAMGHPFIATKITHALVASYTQTPVELEGKFLDLQLIASGLWQGDVESGTSIALSSFKDTSGNAFPGIDGSHTWIVALECGSCRNPAPWYITIIKPCGG